MRRSWQIIRSDDRLDPPPALQVTDQTLQPLDRAGRPTAAFLDVFLNGHDGTTARHVSLRPVAGVPAVRGPPHRPARVPVPERPGVDSERGKGVHAHNGTAALVLGVDATLEPWYPNSPLGQSNWVVQWVSGGNGITTSETGLEKPLAQGREGPATMRLSARTSEFFTPSR